MNLIQFRVKNYRNVIDSGWIEVGDLTAFVGQNEAGKSNLFEALYRVNPFMADASYQMDEDWPVDRWEEKDPKAKVCFVDFELTPAEIESLFDDARTEPGKEDSQEEEGEEEKHADDSDTLAPLPQALTLRATSYYGFATHYWPQGPAQDLLDPSKVHEWGRRNAPKFVYIHDYDLSGARVELDQFHTRRQKTAWEALSKEDQTISIVLDLAKIDVQEFLKKGETEEGRTTRSFDKRAASAYLTRQFESLWRQKKGVRFDIDIDGTTLNIFAEDPNVGMPVRLDRRSTGFRWYVSFAWRFTHASSGEYKGCILLLEEPGIHLHYDGQKDLLEVFGRLAQDNTLLYTTHLASMVDPGYPERIRLVEVVDNHTSVRKGIVSSHPAPMAVIEMCLGLSGGMGGMLGNRQVLIVEGGDDALILQKLSALLRDAGKKYLPDRVYPWPAEGASKTPMYAGFCVGQEWDAGVLLDSDAEAAKRKIQDLYLRDLAEGSAKFRVLMLADAAGIKKTDAAIEDLFPDEFYLDCVNRALGLSLGKDQLPEDGSDMIKSRVSRALGAIHGRELDRTNDRLVLNDILRQFDGWKEIGDLPKGTAARAEKLFRSIEKAFC